jgi:hypothetical protein
MHSGLSKALTGAAWFLVGVGALKKVWQTSPSPTEKKQSKPSDKGSEHKRDSEPSNSAPSSKSASPPSK